MLSDTTEFIDPAEDPEDVPDPQNRVTFNSDRLIIDYDTENNAEPFAR
jgi:hypothetical protein